MNKVITANLNGRAFQVEEQGYEALRAYLDEAARLLADDPDCAEILADLEQAIGDKAARSLGAGRDVVGDADMRRILAEMGPVETGEAGAGRERAEPPRAAPPHKRLYLVKEGAMLAGVCNGLAAYFGIDPTVVRLVFVGLLVLSTGFFVIAYLVLMFIVPTANTAEERAAARGLPFNAQELVDQAKRHYADLKDSHERWRDRRRHHKERAFWRSRERSGYEPGHTRPFDGPQSGYGARVAAGAALPLIGVVSAVVTVAFLIALASLLATGDILGWGAPLDAPPWVAIVALVAAFIVISAPLRALRYASYEALGPGRGWFVFWDGVLWLALVALAAWAATRYVPGVDDFFRELIHGWRALPFDMLQGIAVRA